MWVTDHIWASLKLDKTEGSGNISGICDPFQPCLYFRHRLAEVFFGKNVATFKVFIKSQSSKSLFSPA